jgi:hypothetical protein
MCLGEVELSRRLLRSWGSWGMRPAEHGHACRWNEESINPTSRMGPPPPGQCHSVDQDRGEHPRPRRSRRLARRTPSSSVVVSAHTSGVSRGRRRLAGLRVVDRTFPVVWATPLHTMDGQSYAFDQTVLLKRKPGVLRA